LDIESPKSDYDVRFIYVHKLDYYLSLEVEKKKEVINSLYKWLDLDIVGWELKKALQLLKENNITILEWLRLNKQYSS